MIEKLEKFSGPLDNRKDGPEGSVREALIRIYMTGLTINVMIEKLNEVIDILNSINKPLSSPIDTSSDNFGMTPEEYEGMIKNSDGDIKHGNIEPAESLKRSPGGLL